MHEATHMNEQMHNSLELIKYFPTLHHPASSRGERHRLTQKQYGTVAEVIYSYATQEKEHANLRFEVDACKLRRYLSGVPEVVAFLLE